MSLRPVLTFEPSRGRELIGGKWPLLFKTGKQVAPNDSFALVFQAPDFFRVRRFIAGAGRDFNITSVKSDGLEHLVAPPIPWQMFSPVAFEVAIQFPVCRAFRLDVDGRKGESFGLHVGGEWAP